MGRWRNTETNVVVSVADEKDERFASPLWEAPDEPVQPASTTRPAKTARSSRGSADKS